MLFLDKALLWGIMNNCRKKALDLKSLSFLRLRFFFYTYILVYFPKGSSDFYVTKYIKLNIGISGTG